MRVLFLSSLLALAASVLYRRPSVAGGRLQLVQDDDIEGTIEAAENGLVGGPPILWDCHALVPVADAMAVCPVEQPQPKHKDKGGRKRTGWQFGETIQIKTDSGDLSYNNTQ